MKTNVVVVIPTYKTQLDVFEQASLEQINRVLKYYPKVFVAPESLSMDYGNAYDNIVVERFDDHYFQSTETYSELLLTKGFYERFSEYEYMLIYQLDAFVFSDRLEEFCETGYDYIGAPILGEKGTDIWESYHVGNGGLSLRKISSTIELLDSRNEIMKENPLAELFWRAEDTFFGYCGHRKDIEYKVPSVFVASTFSVQSDAGHGLRDIPKRGLPFGMHMWPRLNYHLWKPIVELYGYELPDIADVQYLDTIGDERKERMESFIRHYLRGHLDEKADIIRITGIDSSKSCVIWGAGTFGKRCLKLLDFLSVDVAYFCDKNAEELVQCTGMEVKLPMRDNLSGKTVIVAVKNKEIISEIENNLKKLDLQEGADYFVYIEMIERMEGYIKERVGDIPGITCPLQIKTVYGNECQ